MVEEVEIYYENGDYFWGDLEAGQRAGLASLVLGNGDSFMGRFKDNQLDGFVQETIGFCDRWDKAGFYNQKTKRW